MKFHEYSLEIVNTLGSVLPETIENYVPMIDSEKYSIRLKNYSSEDCDVELEIDGEDVGTFRVESYGRFTIDRPANIEKRFTFYKVGSKGGNQAGLVKGEQTNGLITAKFIPEKKGPRGGYGMVYAQQSLEPSSFSTINLCSKGSQQGMYQQCNYSQGGTGLHGHSSQRFIDAKELNLDYSSAKTLKLRLVAKNGIDYNRVTSLKEIPTPMLPK